jgi:hypothetical protein
MRVLLAANIIMGILIVAGVLTIVVTLINRAAHPRQPAAITATGHADVELPAGAHLGGMVGAGDRVVLHIVTADGHDRLLTLDPATGAVVETIDFVSAQP